MLAGTIEISPGGVAVTGLAPPDDALAREVLGQVLGEHAQRPARDWLAFLARTAVGDVARRLACSGYLTQASARRRWRGERWVPADADCAFAPVARVKSVLDPARPQDAQGAALAGLAVACGLGSRLALYLPPKTGRALAEAVQRLDPGLREVIAQTQAAMDSSLLSRGSEGDRFCDGVRVGADQLALR